MTDWHGLYQSELLPTLERMSSGPPTAVWAVLAAAVVIGLALLAFGTGNVRLAGLVPLFAASFVGVMVWSNSGLAGRPALYRHGVIERIETEKVIRNNSNGTSYEDTVHLLWLKTSEQARFDASNVSTEAHSEAPEKLVLSEGLAGKLTGARDITTVSLPGAAEAVYLVVLPDGTVLRD